MGRNPKQQNPSKRRPVTKVMQGEYSPPDITLGKVCQKRADSASFLKAGRKADRQVLQGKEFHNLGEAARKVLPTNIKVMREYKAMPS